MMCGQGGNTVGMSAWASVVARGGGQVERDDTSLVSGAFDESAVVKEGCKQQLAELITRVARLIVASLRSGGKVVLFGNGGSGADAQHLAAEFVGRFGRQRRGLAWLVEGFVRDQGQRWRIGGESRRACVDHSEGGVGGLGEWFSAPPMWLTASSNNACENSTSEVACRRVQTVRTKISRGLETCPTVWSGQPDRVR